MNRRPEGPYRIATVAELTGVTEPTLRAWERRYGIPAPRRTPTGYRLYGTAEVKQVLELKRLCERGLAMAEAAAQILRRGPLASVHSRNDGAPDPGPGEAYGAMVNAIVDAVARFDDVDLDRQLRRALLFGSAGQILDRVLMPALIAVGSRWHGGELDIAHEHLASQKIGTLLRSLIGLAPGADASSCAVFASFADDDHDVGLLGFALRVAEWGTRPIFLGARTPPAAVARAVNVAAPRLVALSVSMVPERARARELVDGYAKACGPIPWIVGGAGAAGLTRLVERRGGLIAPADGAALRALIEPLLTERRPRRKKAS